MRIVITGIPGTGKTLLAEKIAGNMNLLIVRIADIARESRLDRGNEHEVDIRKLAPKLEFLREREDYVVEGHLACELRLPSDVVVVLRTHPYVLRERLEKRGYKGEKLKENLEAEMLDYCVQRVEQEYGAEPLELDTTNRLVDESARVLEEAIRQKKKKIDSVNYSKELKEHLEPGGSK
ncbi:AAA family ATPase [Candidatus Micrarchaeota archaeon]|nr:AAA family ATPase [Candidatus Micrarchaeota archaeon]